MSSQELIKIEVEKLTTQVKESLNQVKRIAIAEAWKILQIAIAAIVQIIELIGVDLKGSDKKTLAMNLVSSFYDKVFLIIDIPVVPNLFESIIHKYVKAFLMILVSSSIDATVTIFNNTGVFSKLKVNRS